jgi:hypothetical protein
MSRVEITFSWGSTVRRSRVEIRIGNVGRSPTTKLVMMNSSIDNMNASAAAATSRGTTCGRVTRRNRHSGPAPSVAAASSSAGSRRSRATRAMRKKNGNA